MVALPAYAQYPLALTCNVEFLLCVCQNNPFLCSSSTAVWYMGVSSIMEYGVNFFRYPG